MEKIYPNFRHVIIRDAVVEIKDDGICLTCQPGSVDFRWFGYSWVEKQIGGEWEEVGILSKHLLETSVSY